MVTGYHDHHQHAFEQYLDYAHSMVEHFQKVKDYMGHLRVAVNPPLVPRPPKVAPPDYMLYGQPKSSMGEHGISSSDHSSSPAFPTRSFQQIQEYLMVRMKRQAQASTLGDMAYL